MNSIDPFYKSVKQMYENEKTLHGKLFLIFLLVTYILVLIPVFFLIIFVDIWSEFKK